MDQNILTLNLCVKKSEVDPKVKYGKSNRLYIGGNRSPLSPAQESEVKFRINRNWKRALAKIIPATIMVSASFLIVGDYSLAATTTTHVASLPDSLMPEEIQKVGMYLMRVTAVTGTVLAVLLVQLAGGYKMLRKSRESSEWLTDILKGYATVIVAPILIMTIAFLSWILFKEVPWFISPF